MVEPHPASQHHAHDHPHHHAHDHAHHHAHHPAHQADLAPPVHTLRLVLTRLLVMVLALAVIGGFGYLLLNLTAFSAPAVPKSPFGTGLKEAGGAPGGLSGLIAMLQGLFSTRIMEGLKSFAQTQEAMWSVLAVSFIYGVVHAAGPGHGKAVIAAYMLASRAVLPRGLMMALAAALLQAAVAIGLVGLFSLVLQTTASVLSSVSGRIEMLSFAAVFAVGLWLLWTKAGRLSLLLAPAPADHHRTGGTGHPQEHDHRHDEHCGCGHSHAPLVDAHAGRKEILAAVMAAGIRPCSGAILVLVFAVAQQQFGLGVLAALVMALGTALTTGLLACLAVLARHLASRISGGDDSLWGRRAITGLEVLAAALVAWLGLGFLITGL